MNLIQYDINVLMLMLTEEAASVFCTFGHRRHIIDRVSLHLRLPGRPESKIREGKEALVLASLALDSLIETDPLS